MSYRKEMSQMEKSDYFKKLSNQDSQLYLKKLQLNSGTQLPDPYSLREKWSDDIRNLPPVTSRDVTEYLLDTPSEFTKENLRAYKSLEAYDYFACGHVQDVLYNKINDKEDFCFIKADVLPSQRQSKGTQMYKVWVCLNKKQGWIFTANCTCMAGLGSACSHAAALMFKLEAAVNLQLHEGTAPTSELCQWKQCKKSVTPSPLTEINFKKPKKGDLPLPEEVPSDAPKNYSCSDPTVGANALSKNRLKELYRINKSAAVFTSLSKDIFLDVNDEHSAGSETESDDAQESTYMPQPFTSLFDPSSVNMDEKQLLEHSKQRYEIYSRTYTNEAYQKLEEITRRQSECKSWRFHRAGRITASVCYQAVNTNLTQPCKSVLHTIMQYSEVVDTNATRYGKRMEKEAITMYLENQKYMHKNLQVKNCGLLVTEKYPFLGASPDGIVTCDCHADRILEVKCPYKYREGLFVHAWENDKTFILNKNGSVKAKHQYYYQVQLQMLLSNLDTAHLWIYSPWIHGSTSIVKSIQRDDTLLASVVQNLSCLFFSSILPEIVSRKQEDVENNERLYCTCNRPEFGSMISCEDPQCKIGWFHYPCVAITRKPRRKWLCYVCRPCVAKPTKRKKNQT